MLETINFSGEWWLPTNPEEKVKGNLTFSQNDGARLNLEKSFTKPPETILGVSIPTGRKVTLQGCMVTHWGLLGSPCQVFVHRIVLGEHFAQPEDAKFYSWHCQLSKLFEWLWKSGIEWQGEEFNEFNIVYKCPKTISIDIEPKLKLKIEFNHSIEGHFPYTEIKMNQSASVAFYPSPKANVDEYLKLMHHFRNFLCLATQEATYPQAIIGISDIKSDSSFAEIFYQLDTPVTFT